ncbi:branched-chain amino acid ABC transporter permease [Yinghuangia seranimata]|uniref:branched-chain amino acid ABC transporter permease n=1 Tax=Yinghuangia seranimata TaxID=408067 RepID=UPI00248AA699|nr:branched-chain amino acid ABC transporter permease [Yinghuangia seranimata]MDI2125954.1 branched-chain amino acid ABC transporter permease [Yinghuangia seranimata]
MTTPTSTKPDTRPAAAAAPGRSAPRRWAPGAGVLVAVALLMFVPAATDSFYTFVATRMLLLGLLATAFNAVFGFGGMSSLGHAAFFGIGGYAVGIGVTRWDWSPGTVLAAALAAGALAGAVFGLACLRVRGIYLLLLTLALAQALFGLAFYQTEWTGGDNGIPNIPRDGLPAAVREGDGYYRLTLVVVVLCVALLWMYQRSPLGMSVVGTRESESRMSAAGYRPGALRTVAFAVSGAFSAVAGVLEVYLQGSVSTASMSWQISADVLVYAILGGARHFFGPFLGAVAVTGLEVWVSTYTDRWMTVLGVVYVVTALFLADGVLGRAASLLRLARTKSGAGSGTSAEART